MTIYAAYYEWLDNAGQFYRGRVYVSDPGSPTDDLAVALQGISNAGLREYSSGEVAFPGNAPTQAEFPTGAQVAGFVYACADGGSVRVQVPAPKATIFLPDGLRVDPTQVTALTAAMIATATNVLGSAVTAYSTGTLINRKADVP